MMRLRGTGNRRRLPGSGERGASAVEAAIVTPIVLAMFFGIIELGFLFKDYLAVAGAVRSGVRMASAVPRTATFAQGAVDQVAKTGGAMNFNDIQQIWVYKANKLAGVPSNQQDKPAGFTDFSGCSICVKFKWDNGVKKFVMVTDTWAASSQVACSASGPGGPPDRIGVYIKLKHDAFTGFVFNTLTVSEASVMALEPMPVLTGCK